MSMTRMRRIVVLTLLLSSVPALFAQNPGDHGHNDMPSFPSPYMGQENQAIRTLSEEDIRQLENGEGWGLAKAAELNGVPGPAHLLEMVEQGAIHLSDDQLNRVQGLFEAMKARAIPVGRRLIELEGELNRRFAGGEISQAELERLLGEISVTTAELRLVHLSTHLETLPILSAHQVDRYNTLRGYTAP